MERTLRSGRAATPVGAALAALAALAILALAGSPETARAAPAPAPNSGSLADTVRQLFESQAAGSRDEAERYELVLPLVERAFGPQHPWVGYLQITIAQILFERKDASGALDHALLGEEILRDQLYLDAATLSEEQALRLGTMRESALGLTLTLGAAGATAQDGFRIWDSYLRSRSVVLDEMAARHQAIAAIVDPAVQRLAASLTDARNRLAALRFSEPGGDSDDYHARLHATQLEVTNLETALARRSARYRARLARRRVGLAEVARALPPGSALVAYAYYDDLSLKPRGQFGKFYSQALGAARPARSVLAFVLRAGLPAPTMQPLGRAGTIDSLITRWRELVATDPSTSDRGVSAEPEETPEATAERATAGVRDYRLAAEALRRKVWDPLQPFLGGARCIYVVPDGALSFVNFGTLPVDDDRYLIETGPPIEYLGAERDLAPSAEPRASGAGLLAIGGADFAAETGATRAANAPADTPNAGARAPGSPGIRGARERPAPYRGPASSCEALRDMAFADLPATRTEIEGIATLWGRASASRSPHGGAVTLTGERADETSFKSLAPGRRVLHLATHGFFLPEDCMHQSPTFRARTWRGISLAPTTASAESPLLQSGLALAGANRHSEAPPTGDDGILTAEEIGALDLSSAEWVVLSACETGLGFLDEGEGVLGLRRAFTVAGAHTLILSLWKVDDQATSSWMQALYQAHFVTGRSTADAVRDAACAALTARRTRGAGTHPATWGAFIPIGVDAAPAPEAQPSAVAETP